MTRSILGLILALSALVSGFAAAPQTRRTAANSGITVRTVDTEGLKQLLVRDAKADRPLLVNFWATWCDPCRDEFPDLVQLDADYRKRGLDFIAISLDDESDLKTKVPAFLTEMKATMPAYLLNVSDPEPAILAVDKNWGGSLPATFLYDAQGKVVFRHFGRI